jgi:hypothetical protein
MPLKRQARRLVCGLLLLAVSCGGGSHRTGPPTESATTTPSATSPTPSTPPESNGRPTVPGVETLTAHVTVTPDQGAAGTTFTFSVAVHGPGTVDEEAVQFGDGGTSGANAGMVSCGDTARADHTARYERAYSQPGTYFFIDDVYVIGPQPSCPHEHIRATLTLVVAAPLPSATLNGAFLSPTKNIACNIDVTDTNSVRCATFSPPQLVTMDATGAYQTCYGGTKCELGNPRQETPVLSYGSATGAGRFQCLSTRAGMSCTVAGHKGFTLSRSGITRAE